MFTNAVALWGMLALLFTLGATTENSGPEIVDNCDERINECKKIASTDDEIVEKRNEISTCFMKFMCKNNDESTRQKVLEEYAGKIATALTDPRWLASVGDKEIKPKPQPKNWARINSASYKTLAVITLTVFILAYI